MQAVETAEGVDESVSTLQQTQLSDVRSTVEASTSTWTVDLSPGELREAKVLFEEYSDLWYRPKAGRCTTVTMEIIVKGEPKRAKARPTPPHLSEELNKQVDDLLAAGVIKPAPDCKWVSPCHLVPKPRSDK